MMSAILVKIRTQMLHVRQRLKAIARPTTALDLHIHMAKAIEGATTP